MTFPKLLIDILDKFGHFKMVIIFEISTFKHLEFAPRILEYILYSFVTNKHSKREEGSFPNFRCFPGEIGYY